MHPSALAALSPGPQTGSTSYVLTAGCTHKRAHIPQDVHLILARGDRGWLVTATRSCWMLHRYFHLISSSLQTEILENGHFHPTGEARLWGIYSMSSCTCNGHKSFVQFRSVTQQLSRNLFWQARSKWHLNTFPPFSHFWHVTAIFLQL